MKRTLMGALLSQVAVTQFKAKADALNQLWKRNKLDNPIKREGYKVEEFRTVSAEGNETTSYKLWKLVDQTTLTIKAHVTHEISDGVKEVEYDVQRKPNTTNSNSPI